MSSTTDRIKGTANQAAGAVKKSVGSALGNRKLEAEGMAQEVKGRTQKTVGEAKQGVKNAARTVKNSI